VERGETIVVGVNAFTDEEPPLAIPAPDFRALEQDQLARLARTKAARDQAAVSAALTALGTASASDDADTSAKLMPLIIDAAQARATLGEIANTLATAWGMYRPAR
jgi:methylmalonyl-CoA mutase N-terminal domain/subunit